MKESQLQIDKDMRVKLQTSPSPYPNFKNTEKNLRLIGGVSDLIQKNPKPVSQCIRIGMLSR
jgi:hypothetical protein